MVTRNCVLSAFMFVLMAGFLDSKGCAAEKVDLKLQLRPGQKYNYRITKEQKLSQAVAGQQFNINRVQTIGVGLEVRQIGADGIASITVTYQTLYEKASSPGGQMEYDSTKPETAKGNPFAPTYAALMGQGFMVRVTPKGQIVELKGLDEMFSQMAKKILTAQGSRINEASVKSVKAMLESYPVLQEDRLMEIVGNVFIPFPSQPVGTGDSWKGMMIVPGVPSTEVESVYMLKGSENGVATVSVSSKIQLDNKSAGANKARSGKASTQIIGRGMYQGSIEVDQTSGWVIGKKANMRFTGEMTQNRKKESMSVVSVITVEQNQPVSGLKKTEVTL